MLFWMSVVGRADKGVGGRTEWLTIWWRGGQSMLGELTRPGLPRQYALVGIQRR